MAGTPRNERLFRSGIAVPVIAAIRATPPALIPLRRSIVLEEKPQSPHENKSLKQTLPLRDHSTRKWPEGCCLDSEATATTELPPHTTCLPAGAKSFQDASLLSYGNYPSSCFPGVKQRPFVEPLVVVLAGRASLECPPHHHAIAQASFQESWPRNEAQHHPWTGCLRVFR